MEDIIPQIVGIRQLRRQSCRIELMESDFVAKEAGQPLQLWNAIITRLKVALVLKGINIAEPEALFQVLKILCVCRHNKWMLDNVQLSTLELWVQIRMLRRGTLREVREIFLLFTALNLLVFLFSQPKWALTHLVLVLMKNRQSKRQIFKLNLLERSIYMHRIVKLHLTHKMRESTFIGMRGTFLLDWTLACMIYRRKTLFWIDLKTGIITLFLFFQDPQLNNLFNTNYTLGLWFHGL